MLNVANEVSALERMTVDQLRAKYIEVFGEETRSRHKEYLIKRIIWRMQANEQGDLSERARRRAMELANDADLRSTPPRQTKVIPLAAATKRKVSRPASANRRLPMPGSVLTREYKGEIYEVTVLNNGFSFQGERYKSLSAVAKAITGQHWNGYGFFRLGGGERSAGAPVPAR